ncbi:MAG: Gfo/Idh/MocA family oxidoreductase [Actinobacteria bacterium]|nr:Gfo/Idh/MocA family oxidoreductase [Actinomycetota bacterium]
MPQRIRALVVGAGRGQAQVRAFLDLPAQYELAGWVDLDTARLHAQLDKCGLPRALGSNSFEAAIARSDVDLVAVATWARTHEELVGKALRAGKHVLVEKPYASTLAAAQELQALADQRGCKVVVNQQWRYMPGQRTVRRLMTERAYGEPQTGHMVTYKARGGEYPDSPQSQLWQMTVHEVDSLLAMMNQPAVEVYGHVYRPPRTTWKRESTVTAELTFRNGCRLTMVSTSDARVHTNELRVECERAALVYRNTRAFGGVEDILAGRDRATGFETVPIDPGSSETSDLDRQVAAGLAGWIAGGPEPETSGRNNLQVLAVLDGLIQATATGRPVTLKV